MEKRELSWSRCQNLEAPETEEEEKEMAEADVRFEEADERKELAEFGCPDTNEVEFIEQIRDDYQFNYKALMTLKAWNWMTNEGLMHRLVTID
jgi:hypothetical protein